MVTGCGCGFCLHFGSWSRNYASTLLVCTLWPLVGALRWATSTRRLRRRVWDCRVRPARPPSTPPTSTSQHSPPGWRRGSVSAPVALSSRPQLSLPGSCVDSRGGCRLSADDQRVAMAAVAGAPGLSALLAWPTDHLTEAAAHWETVGERSYGVSHGVWRDALTVDWSGEAAEALRTDTHADMMTTSAVVDQLQSAAGVRAQRGLRFRCGPLPDALRRRGCPLGGIRSGRRSFGHRPDGRRISGTDGCSAGRRAGLRRKYRWARSAAGQRDAQVASRVTAAVAGVGTTFPQAPPTNGQVRAVDSHTFKQDPPSPCRSIRRT